MVQVFLSYIVFDSNIIVFLADYLLVMKWYIRTSTTPLGVKINNPILFFKISTYLSLCFYKFIKHIGTTVLSWHLCSLQRIWPPTTWTTAGHFHLSHHFSAHKNLQRPKQIKIAERQVWTVRRVTELYAVLLLYILWGCALPCTNTLQKVVAYAFCSL